MESVMIVILLYMVVLFLSMKMDMSMNVVSPYECGFDSCLGSRLSFSYRFFLVSILFLIFDVEVTLLVPVPYLGMSVILELALIVFLVILFLGLVYEYFMGVLSWGEVDVSKS